MAKEAAAEFLTISGREVKVSNPGKVYFPAAGITKLELVRYYVEVGEGALRGIFNRPVVLKRYVHGAEGEFFFQKRAPEKRPDWVTTVSLQFPSGRTADEVVATEVAHIAWMANLGCIDLNPHLVRADDLDHPDELRVDLDPGPGVSFPAVREAAGVVREVIAEFGLAGWPKTSGSRGIHVLVPIARRHTFASVREFAGIVAGALARAHPGLVTTEWVKEKRRGVLVDANQNGPGKTNASVYSVRPRAGAPVSTPLRWEEVVSGLDPEAFTMEVVLDRVARDGDLFAGVLAGKQSLARALRALR